MTLCPTAVIQHWSLYIWNLTGKPSRKRRLVMTMEGLHCLLKPSTATELALKSITTFISFLFMKEKKEKKCFSASCKRTQTQRREHPLAYSMLQYIENVF